MSSVMEGKAEALDNISDAELLGIDLENEHCGQTPIKNHGKEGYYVDNTLHESDPVGDVRSLKRKHQAEQRFSPMDRFRRRHLSVTLLCEQSWCEMKVVFGLLRPLVKQKEMKKPEVKVGATIHLTRQLEIHDVVPIQVQSREDLEAIKLLNVMHMMSLLNEGQCVREFPVFGVLEGVFLMGVIDELSYNKGRELVLSELKTRKEMSLPGKAQVKGHHLQVGLYKLLFDGMVNGAVKRNDIIRHLKLQPKQVLGTGVLNHAGSMGVEEGSFGSLVDVVLKSLTSAKVSGIQHLSLEYIHQDSGVTIDTIHVECEEAVLRGELQDYFAYWTGQRGPRGVDIEDAWKCKLCPFEKSCQGGKDKTEACINVDPGKKPK
ncbi:exonuclease V isoform X2 [Clupea harengus]|uniref:Exonuclease V isoform X2 n=1 Tax=Clupea harengus TaxID=7950 RepID=A0A6P8FPC6_CLUHA|nr:exonuclease V isoform X2 [Clupea harengus]